MANQLRLVDDTNRYEAGHCGPRKGMALLQAWRPSANAEGAPFAPADLSVHPASTAAGRTATRPAALCREVLSPLAVELIAKTVLKELESDQVAIAIAALHEIAAEKRRALWRECSVWRRAGSANAALQVGHVSLRNHPARMRRIVRFQEVVLEQRKARQVAIRILWQTGASIKSNVAFNLTIETMAVCMVPHERCADEVHKLFGTRKCRNLGNLCKP
ncbi:hypothetical protein DPM33_35025 [Mesorhizobium hawassense]|uniref:Uncharacterized protein n=1 Tax=Mesorhizobium hawassense TaxID=1209954 RepID=A0A330H0V1_9HYPH|nr:hypothetical protein [Mesorhizobium hawassense]RAZ82186.1 hypothetical protein DPM33_35025 [Mesorhizobium hawassense]